MAGDWIKLHRKLLESAVGSDPWLCYLWVQLLLRANWKPSWFMGLLIEAGQIAFGQESFARELKVNRTKLSRALKKLENWKQIEQQTNNRFTVVTICNWETYQVSEPESAQPTNNKRTSGEHQTRNKRAHPKKDNNFKKDKKVTPLPPLPANLDNDTFRDGIAAWLDYKPPYKPPGLKALITRASRRAEEHGVSAVVKAFEKAMANGHKGWDFDSSFPNLPNQGSIDDPRGNLALRDELMEEMRGE